MPLHWKISPLEHLVVCIADGAVSLADIGAHLDALDKGRALSFQKIFVATTGTSALSKADNHALANQIAALKRRSPLGPMAIVAGVSRNDKLADVFKTLARIDRPLRMFGTIHEARRWLSQRAPEPLRKSKR